jgi:hypothetical protein
VRLRAHAIIQGQFIQAGTPIPDEIVPKAFLKYREGGPSITGLRELPPLEQNGRPVNGNGQWVAVEGADSEVLQRHDLKNKRAYLRLKARMEVDPVLREEHLASLRQCYQRRKAKAGKQGAQPAQTIVESEQDSPAPSLPIEMTFNGEAPVFGARYFQRGGRYKELAGKVAIVTVARNNLGRAFAIALGRNGANIVVHYHRADRSFAV